MHWENLGGAGGEGGGGGIGMGNTCKPMAVSFQCMTKFTTHTQKKTKIVFLHFTFPYTISRGNLGERNQCQKDAILIFHEFSLSSRLVTKLISLSYLLMET